MYRIKISSFKFYLVSALFAMLQVTAFAANYPNVITDFSGSADYCQYDAAANLSVTFSTCRSGNAAPTNVAVIWYSNTVNATSGGTQVARINSNTFTTTFTYRPSTLSVGTLYYYVEITWASSGDPACGDAGTLLTSTQTVQVNPAAPSKPGAISGSSLVTPGAGGLVYTISSVPDADTYNWAVPFGWSITAGQGTTSIVVTSGVEGQNGDISVAAANACGTSAAVLMPVISGTSLDHSLYGCNACHITHDALGGSLINTLGNSNLCLSCHVSSGAASSKPFTEADKAIPGSGGTSHAWDVASENASYETVLTTDPGMLLRVDEGNITCSTCHDQHSNNSNPNYTRISNAGDFMCKDCHSPRDVGPYVDNPPSNRGSHPVGLVYSGTGDLEPVPTGAAIVVDGNIECSSCHMTHYASTSDGNLLRQTNDDALCTSCHMLGTHNGMSCGDCHQSHNTDKSNIYLIRNTITTPSSGDRTVIFNALTGANSFADGDGTYDGICEVCHTTTIHYLNDGSASDQDHTSSGGPMDGRDCTSCHPHNEDFNPAGCDDCHNAEAPTFASAVHVKHKDRYGYTCSTCHFQYGSGGDLEGGTHPNASIDVNFNPDGMATRNGQDAITPVFNGDKTCDNIYCHSNGRSAYRGTDGTYTWSGTTGPQSAVYATTPVWDAGSITTCMSCHSGTGNMTDPYTVTIPGANPALPPSTGAHRRGVHLDNDQELSGNGWTVINCFWCHNAADGDDGSPILQGTYGTSFHVDGTTFFDPRSFVDGGTTVNSNTGGSFSYSALGSSAHCGTGRSCW